MGDRASKKPTDLFADWVVAPLTEPLTRREREILAYLESDLSVSEMAGTLFLALSSTKWYIQQIYGKLGVNNRRQAVSRARELGLLGGAIISTPVADGLAPQHNLPAQISSFIGREQEIAEVSQLVRSHRLVTLSGPGGVGKTRLGLEVGRSVFGEFRDGIWFSDLTALADPALIPGSLLATLSLRTGPRGKCDRSEVDLLVHALQAKSVLLILDNCEHLLEACARLVDEVLRHCQGVHLLATSREALNVAGEQAYLVPALKFPDPNHLPPLEALSRLETVQLFVERARSVDRQFNLGEKNAQAIAQICQRLDGIPLAIELAAARVKVLAPEQIAGRLDDAFSLLTGGSRTALPRHQTLQALIEWSYNLLSATEKVLFRRLAVFSGGWSLEAAEFICAEPLQYWENVRLEKENSRPSFQPSNLQSEMVLDLLGRLVEKSLVLKEEQGGQARFRMLETIRQYAQFQLFTDEQEVLEVKKRHRDWFLKFAETAAPLLDSPEQIAWLGRLELEHDNLRSALRWSLEQKEAEAALRLAGALEGFWNTHSHNQEAYRWTQQALDLAENDPAIRRSYSWATVMIGYFTHVLTAGADIAAILPRLEEARQICLQQDDIWLSASVLNQIGIAEANLGHWETAERYFREGIELVDKHEDSPLYGFLLLCLGVAVAERGDYATCREYYRQCLDLSKLHGNRRITLYTMHFFAEDLILQGQLKAALELCLQAVDHAEALGSRHEVLRGLVDLARTALLQGDYARAREWAWKAYRVEEELGGSGQGTLVVLAAIDTHENRLEAAYAKAHEALDLARREKDTYELFNTLFKAYLNLGSVALNRADPSSARKFLDEAQKLYSEIVWYKREQNYLLTQALAHAARLEGDNPEALRLYGENLGQMLKAQHYLYAPESLEGLAMVAVEENRPEQAACYLGAAQALREQLGTPLPPVLQSEYDACQARLKQDLPQEEFARQWKAGRGMKVEQVLQ